MNLFDVVNGILDNKKSLFEDPEAIKKFDAFMVNRALSYHQDTLYYANDMNMLWQLEKKPKIDFYLNTIRAKRRSFVKWSKPFQEDDLKAVMMYFGYSAKHAAEALKLLTPEQITLIKERTDKGE